MTKRHLPEMFQSERFFTAAVVAFDQLTRPQQIAFARYVKDAITDCAGDDASSDELNRLALSARKKINDLGGAITHPSNMDAVRGSAVLYDLKLIRHYIDLYISRIEDNYNRISDHYEVEHYFTAARHNTNRVCDRLISSSMATTPFPGFEEAIADLKRLHARITSALESVAEKEILQEPVPSAAE